MTEMTGGRARAISWYFPSNLVAEEILLIGLILETCHVCNVEGRGTVWGDISNFFIFVCDK